MNLFLKYQQPLLKLANNPLGRYYLGISKEVKDKIIGLAPNAYATQVGRKKFQATFRCYNLFEKKLGGALKFSDSLLEGIKYYFTPQQIAWIEFATTSSIYTSAGDGSVGRTSISSEGDSFASMREGAGTDARGEVTPTYIGVTPISGVNFPQITFIGRGFFPFVTSSLIGATKESAYLSLYPTYKGDYWSASAYSGLDVILTTQASMTALATGDYQNLTLNSPDKGNTRLDLGDITINQYNNFTLNATGLGWVDIEGNTKLGIREGHDTDAQIIESAPPENGYISGVYTSTSEEAGTDQDPKLVVTYTLPSSGGAFLYNLM